MLVLKILLASLLFLSVTSQDDEEGSGGNKDGNEEAWEYVEFLKTISGNVEDILQNTLYTAKDNQKSDALDNTISIAMEQVMQIREELLTRIKNIRKGVIETDEEQNIKQEKVLSEFRREIMTILLRIIDGSNSSVEKLKEISQDLLRFKLSVSNEVMRLLMLPGRTFTVQTENDGCEGCVLLAELSYQLENLVKCSEQEKPIEDIDLPSGQGAISRPGEARTGELERPEPGTFCVEPNMYAMELIAGTEKIDAEIKKIYNALLIETDDTKRQERIENLEYYKGIRVDMDEVITKLLATSTMERLRKLAKRSLPSVYNRINNELAKCKKICNSCDSCAAEVLYDAIAKMDDYSAYFDTSREDSEKKEYITSDMMRYISDMNAETKEILIKKVMEEDLDSCSNEKLEVFGVLKQPFWMLVQTAIQGEDLNELVIMVGTMKELLQQQLGNYCDGDDDAVTSQKEEGPKCDWQEYEHTKEYTIKLDEIIQDSLYKDPEKDSQLNAILGFVEVQEMIDKRVKSLFEAELVCPEEVSVVKKKYMSQLTKCMSQLMNNKIQFKKMSRIQRISCTKELRNTMDERMAKLLRKELEESFNQLDTELPDFLTDEGGSGDRPITDIDLPAIQESIVRPG